MTARSLTMLTLHDTGFGACRWWNDGWTLKTVVTLRSSASMIPAAAVAVVVVVVVVDEEKDEKGKEDEE